ncbi:NAD(P)H quinone oxidoreductase [Aliidongia dinghuensis]|uniref:NAD(P)H quinone oxidoreductase n=1 Tax=Aliidongia dinghuensis TaxID=1867774 RepID=A0A8J3E5T5_9PROT|nr:NAD(P)H-quinone oxidoreductase [Aliidongia dinghuensis]GGF37933.1 NAD(P)H quinone oxidoreductase [Aliidongia dinghuensis]
MTALPQTMTAIEIATPGEADVLRPSARPVPAPAAGEVLIKVAAAGVNRPDVLQRQGHYAPPPGATDIPGLEVAGTVVALGFGAHHLNVGDQVCALLAGGGYAEYCAVPAVQCLPVPAGLSFEEAAGLPETFFTVWSNLVDRAHFTPGKTVLIHGGTSGIGTTAIQLVKALGGRAFATAGSYDKAHACERLGAERGINYQLEDFVQITKELTHGHGVDIILDMVAGDYVARNLQAAAVDGVIVNIAFLRGAKVEIDINLVMRKRLTLTGSTLRPRSPAEKGAIAEALHARVWPLIASGAIKPVLYKTFPLAHADEAHRLMESGAHIGKIVLTV